MNRLTFLGLKSLIIFLLLIPLVSLTLGFGFNLIDSGPSGWVLYVVILLVLLICCGNGVVATIKWRMK